MQNPRFPDKCAVLMRLLKTLAVRTLLLVVCVNANAANIGDSAKKELAADGVASKTSTTNDSEGLKLFAEQIRPVLEQNCLECHGGKRTRSGFDLSTREALLRGGDNGPAIARDNPESSRFIRLLRHLDDPGMPYKKPRLDDALIAKMVRWIALDTPYDGALKSAAG